MAMETQNLILNNTKNSKIHSLFAPDEPGVKTFNRIIDSNDKLNWLEPDETQLVNLTKYLENQLEKYNGEALITIDQNDGLTQDEIALAEKTLHSFEKILNISIIFLKEKKSENTKIEKFIRDYIIRRNMPADDFIEIRVAVVGNVDAGKSTLLGVLTHGILDDGRGEARTKLFRHKHEIESGRTSSVGNDILGFDSNGNIVNNFNLHSTKDWEEICSKSNKVITFIDLAGHEKYLKTTVFGMTGHAPDYCMLMVGSNMGAIGMTKEHLGLALALNVPVFIVLTKIDMCPPNVLQDTIKVLLKILKSPGCRKLPYLIENHDDVVTCAKNFTSERLCPIFQVSNVTGKNIDLVKAFLNLLNSRMEHQLNEPAEFQIDEIFSVPGVGTVVSGTCYKGRIQLNDTLRLGPDLIGHFKSVVIKGIHRKRMPVKECMGGQTASFALKKIKRSELRKGMVLISEKLEPISSWAFEAEILVLHHPTTISVNYQAMVHCGSIRQTATILEMSVEHMRTGDKAIIKLGFIKNPEYLKPGLKMIFREGRTKAIGTITKINLSPTPKLN
ncbi:unnamed protein product [Brachionus calyciflorus]|uniref:Tr-type G domain-containing protein n=1 Tax=Brachionus calyciflorus TaxID=104777 RepID=A0A813Y995_9BILA|nr:unnamed protein product [Brachionus calyciflorus]